MALRNKFLLYMLIPMLIAVCAGVAGMYINALLYKEFSYVTGNVVPSLSQLGELKSAANSIRDIVTNEDPFSNPRKPPAISEEQLAYLRVHTTLFAGLARSVMSMGGTAGEDSTLRELRSVTDRLLRHYRQASANRLALEATAIRTQLLDDTGRLNTLIDLRVQIELGALTEREALASELLTRMTRFHIMALGIAFALAYVVALLLAKGMDVHLFERRAMDLERSALRDQLNHAEQLSSLGTMSAIVAHRLRQPLTSTSLFLQDSLKELALPEPRIDTVVSTIDWSLKEVERASATIKSVLALAHVSASHKLESASVAKTVERVVGVLQEQANKARIKITTKGDPALEVPESPGDLQQVIFTIAQNAIQAAAGKENSKLDIGWWIDNGEVVLAFMDSCGGIPEENIDKIFDLFFSTKAVTEGTGLGLCIVQQIVTRLGGSVKVHSNFPVGAEFVVRLPQVAAEVSQSDVVGVESESEETRAQ